MNPASIREGIIHRTGPAAFTGLRLAPVVVCLVRDAEDYLPEFLEHHLGLGAGHLFFLDNGSKDRTREIITDCSQASLFTTALPFKDLNLELRQAMVDAVCPHNHWALVLDADEFFDYPGSGQKSLPKLAQYLEQHHYTAMLCYFLDMFADLPFGNLQDYNPPSLREGYPLYDLSDIRTLEYFVPEEGYHHNRFNRNNTLGDSGLVRRLGGIRKTSFGLEDLYLMKHPLFKNDGTVTMSQQHFVDHAHVADVTGLLRHYKFTQRFAKRAQRAVKEKNYANDSAEYTAYLDVLEKNPDLNPAGPDARSFKNADQLVDEGYLAVSDVYRKWLEESV